MAASKKTGVLVLVAEAHLDRLNALVSALKRKGLHVTNVLESAGGTVTGTIDPDKIDALREVDGVEAVLPDEEKRTADHGSPAR